jgi:dihydroorotate dehydrogenase (NAD+) catalytic subunit
MVDLGIRIGGASFANPVLLASGTCNYGRELAGLLDLAKVGGLITKTITPRPRAGNRPPRIVETPAGLLNSIGLQNPGIEAFLAEQWPFLRTLDTRVVVNIAGESADEFGELAGRLDQVPGIAALEVNISCPNVERGGLLFGSDPVAAASVIAAVRRATRLPVIAKLTPNVTDIAAVAVAVESAGADAVSLINTLVGMAVDLDRRRPVLGNVTGGLSGPAIKPVALAMVWKAHRAIRLPIIGVGGICSARDALEFIVAGATAVQIGTASFVDPCASALVVDGIRAYCEQQRVTEIGSLVGALVV